MGKYIPLLFILSANSANAAVISYTDRSMFDAVVGATEIENFESFVVDTPFHTTPVDVGAFTISMSANPSTSFNYIDIAPASTSETDVDGSTNMRVLTSSAVSSNLTFTFSTAIYSFGADFRSLNDTINRTQLLVGTDIIELPIAANSGLISFFGIASDVAFTSITFEGLANDAYGIDNIAYTASPVPVPAAIWLFGSSLIGLVGFKRKINKSALTSA